MKAQQRYLEDGMTHQEKSINKKDLRGYKKGVEDVDIPMIPGINGTSKMGRYFSQPNSPKIENGKYFDEHLARFGKALIKANNESPSQIKHARGS